MVWSNWKGAVLLLLAGVGLAWSQAPSSRPAPSTNAPATNAPATGERIMTVHENGKSLRCRVLASWRTAEGKTAYQLQVIETREMLTIEEAGAATVVAGGKTTIKALPMRIYHWGRANVPPQGAPVAPEIVTTAYQNEPVKSEPTKSMPIKNEPVKSAPVMSPPVIMEPVRNEPVQAEPIRKEPVRTALLEPIQTVPLKPSPIKFEQVKSAPPTITVPPSRMVTTIGKEKCVWWEEKDGKRVGPEIITTGKNPFAVSEVVMVPDKSTEKVTEKVTEKCTEKCTDNCTDTGSHPIRNPFFVSRMGTSAPTCKNVSGCECPPTVVIQENQPMPSLRPKLGDRIANLFKGSDTVKKPADPTPVIVMEKDKQLPAFPPLESSTKSDPNAKTLTNADLAASEKPEPSKAAKKDWKSVWGITKETKETKENKTQIPGKPAPEQVAKNETKEKKDVLLDPERFDATEKKLAGKGSLPPPPKTDGTKTDSAKTDPTPKKDPIAQVGNPPVLKNEPSQKPEPGQPLMTPNGQLPLGSASVIAADSGVPAKMTYVPVPVWTQPEPYRPPLPPPPKVPDAPQPNTFVNAFSPPPAPKQPGGAEQPPMMAQGYPPLNPAQLQLMQMQMQQMQKLQQMQMQQNPMMPMMPSPQRPLAQVNYPTQYQGPLPPNPVQNPVQQVSYQQLIQQSQFNAAMDRRTVGQPQAVNQAEMGQLFVVLKQSLYPAQREWAANNLATYDPRQHPEVVAVLLDCAKQDPAATVRASCVYSISRMGVTNEAIVGTLQTLRQDSDPRVRQEVEQTLQRMGVQSN